MGRDHALQSQARELLRSLGADKLAREVRVQWNARLKTCAGRADYREKLISLNPFLLELSTSNAIPQLSDDKLECNMHSSFTGQRSIKDGEGKLDGIMPSSLTSATTSLENADGLKWSASTALVEGVVLDEVDRTLRHELAHLLAQSRVGRRRIAPHGTEWRQACRDLGIADEARCHNLPFATKVYPPRYLYRCPNCKEEFPRARRIRRSIACLRCCRKHNSGNFDDRFRLRRIK
jgi:predicted SprT family Zn-dependent metalloprotease